MTRPSRRNRVMHKAQQDRAIARLLSGTNYYDPEGRLATAQDTDREGLEDSEALDELGRGGPRAELREDMVTRDVRASVRHRGGKTVRVKAHRQRYRHTARSAIEHTSTAPKWDYERTRAYLDKLDELERAGDIAGLKEEGARLDLPNSLLDDIGGVHERLARMRVTNGSKAERSRFFKDMETDETIPYDTYAYALNRLSDAEWRKHSDRELGAMAGMAEYEGDHGLARRLRDIADPPPPNPDLGRAGKILGRQLTVDDPRHPANVQRLRDLDLLSDEELHFMRERGIHVHLVAQERDGLFRERPELLPFRSLIHPSALGFYFPTGELHRHLYVFHTDEPPVINGQNLGDLPVQDANAWASTVLHEVGHALDAEGVWGSSWSAFGGISPTEEARDLHAQIQTWRREKEVTTFGLTLSGGLGPIKRKVEAPVVRDYFQGTPGGTTGAKEIIAEGYSWLRMKGWEACAEHFLDDGLANHLELGLLKKFPNADIAEHG